MATPKQITMISEILRVGRHDVGRLKTDEASKLIDAIKSIYQKHKGGDVLARHRDFQALAHSRFPNPTCGACRKPYRPDNTPDSCSC